MKGHTMTQTDDALGPELLPCPFCGATARLLGGPMAQETYSIWCSGKARHHLDALGYEEATAIAAWNTRADLAPHPVGAVKVNPLVWEYHPAGSIAAPPTGFAYIIDTRMKGRVYSLKGFNPKREFASMDEAKAAAQVDYQTRIRSALETTTQPDPLADPRVRALRDENEALRSLMSDLIQGARRDRSILIQRLGPLHVIETRVTKGQVLEAMRLTRKDQPHD